MQNFNRSVQKGFTLIELMIVIAILGILIAIALPAYQDYTIRTKNAECLNVAAAAKLAVSETFQSNNAWPATNAAAGYAFLPSSYCADVQVGAGGVIVATTQATGAAGTFTLTPASAIDSGRVEWACTNSFTNQAHSPAECRP
jgi:prepilin-type N-terminal cleavage/methylation domain-containing protein